MTPETGREAECWIKLSLLTALSVPEILRLLQQTGGVEALFDASSGTLTKLAGETAAREIREVNSSGEAERILSWLSETKGVGFITLADPRYPRLMIEAGAAPVLLWYRGDAGLLDKPVLTVGGSTHPDREALYNAEVFGEALGTRNELLLSTGHFPGTETAFLASVLRAGGRALVWQPCGPDRVWPSEGRDILHELLAKGGLIMTAVARFFARGAGAADVLPHGLRAGASGAQCRHGLPSLQPRENGGRLGQGRHGRAGVHPLSLRQGMSQADPSGSEACRVFGRHSCRAVSGRELSPAACSWYAMNICTRAFPAASVA
jgi:hypothetical protein